MTTETEGLFDDVDTAGSTRYPFLPDGDFDLEVEYVQSKLSQSKMPFFKVVAKVLTSTNPELKAGQLATIRVEKDPSPKKSPMYIRDVLSIASALMGRPSEVITKQDLQDIVASDQPAKGTKFRARRAFFETSTGGVSKWTKYVPEGVPFPETVSPPPADAPKATATKRK